MLSKANAAPFSQQQLMERRRQCRRKEGRRLLQRDRELEAAQHACHALFQHHSVDELVKRLMHTALEAVQAEAGSVLLAGDARERLVFQYVIGEKAELLEGQSIDWDKGVAGAVFQSGVPAVIPVVDAHHGSITLESQPGVGTTFRIQLSINPNRAQPRTQGAASQAAQRFSGSSHSF